MNEGWYLISSTESGIELFLSWWQKEQKEFEGITFENSIGMEKIGFLKIAPDKIKNFKSKIIESGRYSLGNTRFGEAFMIYNKPEEVGIYFKKFELLIGVRNIELLKNIVEIKHIEPGAGKSLIDGKVLYLLIGFLIFLSWGAVIFRKVWKSRTLQELSI